MTLQRKIRRSVGKQLSFYLTGSILTAITVMLLVGAFAVSNSLYSRFDEYFLETKIEDASFVTLTPIPDEELEELEKTYDVTLERQQYVDLTYGDTKLRVFAETEEMDLHTVSEGRDIEAEDEVLVTWRYAKANDIAVGDVLTLAGQDFTVCGLGMKSDYAVMFYDLSESMPDKEGFGIGIVSKKALERIGKASEYYSVRYGDRSRETAFRTATYEQYETQEYLEREANSRISLIYSEADDLVSEFTLYCPIIMIVVVAVIAMVLARTVRREGKNIGTLMALGYRKKELIRHYMVYGMIPAVAGDVLGLLFSFPFAKAFCGFYFADAEYLDYVVRLPWKLMLVAFLIPIVVYGVVSYLVLCRVLSSDIVPEYGFNGSPAAGRESVPDSRYCVEAVEGVGNADLRDDCCDDVRDDRGGEPEKYFHARCARVSWRRNSEICAYLESSARAGRISGGCPAWVSHGIFHDPCRGTVLGNDYEPAGQSGDNPEQLSVCRRGIPAGNAFIRTEAEEGGHGREPEMRVGVNGNKPDGLVLPFKIIRQETPTSCRS